MTDNIEGNHSECPDDSTLANYLDGNVEENEKHWVESHIQDCQHCLEVINFARKRIGDEITSMTGGKAPEDLARVLRVIFAQKQKGEVAEAGALISWLSGSSNVSVSEKKAAGIKGDISGPDAMKYLRGVLEIVKAAGYKGLVVIIDEAETILRMRRDVRGKSLNGIRQIIDDAAQYQGLLWVFTGTPEFFDTRRGVAGLQPLHDRIRFISHEGGRVCVRLNWSSNRLTKRDWKKLPSSSGKSTPLPTEQLWKQKCRKATSPNLSIR